MNPEKAKKLLEEQMKQAKRVVFSAKDTVEIEDFALNLPKPNQVLVKTKRTLISAGTEVAFLRALPNTTNVFPMYPGYSNTGIVLSVGQEITHLKAGDRVVCRGPHATHVLVSGERAWHIPKEVSFEEATFFALGTIALQGIRKAKVELGDSVVVLGQGLVGLLALQLAKLSGGVPVIGVDLYEYRLDISSKVGADCTINPVEFALKEEVEKLTDGKGADVVIEATGNPEVISTAFKLSSRYGRVVLLGSPRGKSQVNFYSEVHKRGLSVIGAHNSLRPRLESSHGWWTLGDDTILVLKLLCKNRLKVRDLVTLRMDFNDAAKAYETIIESMENIMGIMLTYD